jgi:hypothetical protein
MATVDSRRRTDDPRLVFTAEVEIFRQARRRRARASRRLEQLVPWISDIRLSPFQTADRPAARNAPRGSPTTEEPTVGASDADGWGLKKPYHRRRPRPGQV